MESLQWFLKDVKRSDSVVILGDIFDNRSSVDFRTLNDAIDFFIMLTKKCKEVFVLVGNHDLYYKETELENVNCRFLRFIPEKGSKKAPVQIVHEIKEINIQNQSCLFIPWVDSKEKLDCAREFLSHPHDVVFGHLDSTGLYSGKDIDTSMMFDTDEFNNNKVVMSGHYHKRKQRGILNYVGSFINQTFNDVGDVKGYHTIDKDCNIEFIEGICPKFEYVTITNPSSFMKGYEMTSDEEKQKIADRIDGNIIKLILNEYSTENDELFKIFKGMNPLEISISYNRVAFEEVDGEDVSFEGFDTKSDMIDIITEYINKIQDKLPEGVSQKDIVDLISAKHITFKTAS
jgi:DNA repair exonuclease SbcCD nuclease subunit